MCCNISHSSLFQLVTNSCCDPFPLIVCMDKKPVKITGLIYVPKAYNNSIFNSNYTIMFLKGLVPFF